MPNDPYNPLARRHLAESIARTLIAEQPLVVLGAVESFRGAGIYLVYYRGPFPAYADLSASDTPIYVGKAVPKGSRRGEDLEPSVGTVLFDRLNEHAQTIQETSNLDLADFNCRYLTVEDIFIPLGESLLINRFRPIWNVKLAGFGNHDPGNGRYNQQRSQWDTVHPGRSWALRCKPNKQAMGIIAEWGGGEGRDTATSAPLAADPAAPAYKPKCPKSDDSVS